LYTSHHTTEVKLSSSVRQESGLVSASVGQSLTLRCFYEHDDSTRIFWYKQSLGQQPRLISTLYVFNKNGTFHDEYKNNPRFTLDTDITGKNHLTITDLHPSDSATYYCAGRKLLTVEFAAGIFVSIKGSGLNIPASVHQSASESIQPGGSVTLNCTVHTGTCDGEHSVYWFKTSEESHPGLIYTHGGRNDQCERKPNNQTHTCVYNLPMQSLDLSHAGTYYCAVVSCGHILFGDGTKLDFEALAFTTILVALLAFSVFKLIKRYNCQCTGNVYHLYPTDHQDTDNLHYAALSNCMLHLHSVSKMDSCYNLFEHVLYIYIDLQINMYLCVSLGLRCAVSNMNIHHFQYPVTMTSVNHSVQFHLSLQ
uniref:Ig-like domain-containing protein n=1 Tax=Dicentrarchus labrax TaxID=13489 RepID=A0A8P4GLG3_DICLA